MVGRRDRAPVLLRSKTLPWLEARDARLRLRDFHLAVNADDPLSDRWCRGASLGGGVLRG